MTQAKSQSESLQSAIDQCLKTFQVCTKTMAAGLEINEDQDFITSLKLCGQTCQLAAESLLLDSPFYNRTCALCAEFCEIVAELCEDFDEPEMQVCALSCTKCAQTCRSLAADSGVAPSLSHPASPQSSARPV